MNPMMMLMMMMLLMMMYFFCVQHSGSRIFEERVAVERNTFQSVSNYHRLLQVVTTSMELEIKKEEDDDGGDDDDDFFWVDLQRGRRS